jgi:hypothetical protein
VPYTDDREEFHGAMRRLRGLLLGDGMDVPGRLKGEEARSQATRDLRRMREAFEAVVARSEEDRTEKAVEARVADLEVELTSIAASTARRAGGAIPPPKKSRSGRSPRKKTPSRKRKRKT